MLYYIPKERVFDSIEYFKNAAFDADDMLFLFLFSKHLGITTNVPITYQTSRLSEEQRKEYLKTVWMLGGLFDSTETCTKKGLLFPTAFKKMSSYQPGTDFASVTGRIKDTVEKKNINAPIYRDNASSLTLVVNYKDLIRENYLRGTNRISLAQLAVWLFRFTGFEFDSLPNEKVFTRVVEKAARKLLKISKTDFLWLFDNDLAINRIVPATSGITGSELRSKFEFEDGKSPEVAVATARDTVQSDHIEKAITEKYMAINGDNPPEQDIYDTLLLKKQIVLTGVPGVGKSRYTTALCNKEQNGSKVFKETKIIQFHAGFSYEDFIGHETLTTTTGATAVSTKKGVFLDFVNSAAGDTANKYLLVIDELNRGNIAEIFGETILALDRDYTAILPKAYEGISELKIPDNLYIVATMNTSDRNIAFLDLAIRRRFAFINLTPNYDVLSEEVSLLDIDLGNVLRIINQRILNVLKDPEMLLGQSYFIPPKSAAGYLWTKDDFKNQFNFVVLPTLREYSFNDPGAVETIVGELLCDGIQDTDEFINAFKAEFAN